jgi:hypothetical protein
MRLLVDMNLTRGGSGISLRLAMSAYIGQA